MRRVLVDLLQVPRSMVFPGGIVLLTNTGWVTVTTNKGAWHHFPVQNVARVVEEDVDE